MALQSSRDRNVSHLVGIGLALGFLLPHSYTFLLIVNPLLCVLFWSLNKSKRLSNVALLVFVSLLISVLINLTQLSSLKPLFTCVTIMMYVVCFPLTDKYINVPCGYFFFTAFVIFLTQIAYILDVSFITSFLDSYYPIEGDLESMYSHLRSNVTFDNMLSYRLGGLYRNPNQCARSLTLLLASYLLLFKNRKTFWFVALTFVGVVLTGSRTGFIIAALIIVAYIFFCVKVSPIAKIAVIAAAVGVVSFMLIAGASIFRAVDIASGMGGSSTLKFNTFVYYFQNEPSFVRLLFGYLDPKRFQSGYGVMDQFDADYGYLVFDYGLVGFVMILVFNLVVFLKTNKQGRVFFLVLLWMVTGTVFSSYRAVFVYILLLSLVYNKNQNGRHIKGIKV